MKIGEKYIVFTQEAHENVQFDWNQRQVEEFVKMWNKEKPINEIARALNATKLSVVLLVMDLNITGRIKPRKTGLGVG